MIPILAAVAGIFLVVGVIFIVSTRMKGSKGGLLGWTGGKSRNREAVIREATKRLASNPNDAEALFALAGAYFEEENWEKALKNYELLIDHISVSPVAGIDNFEAYMKYGMSAQKLNMPDLAHKGFSIARTYKQDSFEVNYGLGVLEFDKRNYEKAIQLLQTARTQDPESAPVLRYLGHALFRIKKPKEAMSFIRKAIDIAPDDKESLYTLAECYHEANQIDQALRIFNHLRADPVMGPESCLIAGNIHLDSRKYETAIQDFEIGLKHENIKPDILTELRYRLATTYLKQNEIAKAIPLLKLLQKDNPTYKDVNVLLGKYAELNSSRNLQIFLMAPQADFVALCRKVVMGYFPKAKVKISNISVNKNEWADILAEVDTAKWSDLVMYRFIRTQGSIGELIIRDFHSHLKEVKAGKGICLTVGNYTEEAKRYTEARLIDLIEKDRLQAILNAVDSKAAVKK
jgi:tetratricopeptide (TPR) repeat protein